MQAVQTACMSEAGFRPVPLLAALTLALAGCATVAPPAVDPAGGVAAPAGWSAGTAARDAASLAGWWQRFGDAELSRLVADALAANTEVAAAQAALRQSRALFAVTEAQAGPQLGSSASAQRSRANSNTGNSFRAGFDASWEPDVFGANRAGVAAREADTQASAANLGDVQVSVAAEVALAYLGLRGAEARLEIARQNLAAQEETAQITRWRVQAGLATSLESEQARASVEQTRAQIPSLQKSITQSRHVLALLTGRTADTLALAASTALPQPAADLALAFPADTLRQRADVRAAEWRLRAAAERVAQADASRYPSFQLSGSLGLQALTLSALSGGGAAVSSLLASVAWPVFDGGAARAQLDAQQAAFDQARAAHRGTVLSALKDVEDALVALRSDRERLATLQQAAEAAGNAALLARQRYASGLIDFQTVLETQRSLLSAQDNVAASRIDVATDHVRLYKALGGGWTPDTERPAAAPATNPSS